LHLAIRAVIAAALAPAVLRLIPGSPAAPADVLCFALWFVLTGRSDLAPPPERQEEQPLGWAPGSGWPRAVPGLPAVLRFRAGIQLVPART
jgi:hypothetical protein